MLGDRCLTARPIEGCLKRLGGHNKTYRYTEMRMEPILVTGEAGNVGSALIPVLVQRPDTKAAFADNLLTGSSARIPLNASKTCVKAHEYSIFENDAINVGSDHETSIFELARTVLAITGSASLIEFLPTLAEADIRRRGSDISKMRRLLDRSSAALEDGIRRLVAHYTTERSVGAMNSTLP